MNPSCSGAVCSRAWLCQPSALVLNTQGVCFAMHMPLRQPTNECPGKHLGSDNRLVYNELQCFFSFFKTVLSGEHNGLIMGKKGLIFSYHHSLVYIKLVHHWSCWIEFQKYSYNELCLWIKTEVLTVSEISLNILLQFFMCVYETWHPRHWYKLLIRLQSPVSCSTKYSGKICPEAKAISTFL